MKCPVCGSEAVEANNEFVCSDNHVFHMCKTHNKPVVTSLIGEKSFDDFDECSCL